MRLIQNKKWFKPREIAQLGLIQSSSGTNNEAGNYNFILELIKAGKLRAKDYSVSGGKPYWLISEDEIKRWHRATSNRLEVTRKQKVVN